MPNNVTVTVSISGVRDVPQGAGIGPKNFTRTFSGALQAPEMPVYIPATTVDEPIVLPPLPNGQQGTVIICTDNPVSYRINAEAKPADKGLGQNGQAILPSTPLVTQIILSGNGATASQVYILQVGS